MDWPKTSTRMSPDMETVFHTMSLLPAGNPEGLRLVRDMGGVDRDAIIWTWPCGPGFVKRTAAFDWCTAEYLGEANP